MKKNIIALAIASVVAAPVAMAGAPTIYGQVSMAVDSISSDNFSNADSTAVKTDNTTGSGVQINSRTSKFGIKGSEDLGDGLTAVYKFEFEVNIDDASQLSNRNQYVGVAGGFGTVLLGRHDTPLKMAQGTDLFNYSPYGDINPMAGGLGALGRGGELRLSNVLAYVSPSFSGVTLVGAFVPKETGNATLPLAGDITKESSLTDITSFAVMYGSKKEGLYLSGAMDSISKSAINGTNVIDQMRLVAQYSTGGLVANVMYQDFGGSAIENTTWEGTTIGGAVAYKVGKFTPRLQIMQVDRTDNGAGVKFEDSLNYALGVDYALGKKTTVFAEYATLDNAATDTTATPVSFTRTETTALSVGLTHKF